MRFRILLAAMASLPYVYAVFRLFLMEKKRQEPLPEEVADVFTKERRDTFVAYKKELKAPFLLSQLLAFLVDLFVILSPFYAWMERLANGNPYGTVAITAVVLMAVSFLVGLPVSYYRIFTIETKYGLNHRTKQKFFKDEITEFVTGTVLNTALYLLLAFILQHLPVWTNQFQIPLYKAVLIMAGITAVIVAFLFLASSFSWLLLRVQYKFTPLQEGELKQDILKLLKGSRKKVRRIEVYNESAKSTSKNAFVLKLPFFRSIGIADNFLAENSHRELLAVLAHEAGHLKHKPSFWNILNYCFLGALFCLLVAALVHGAVLAQWEQALEGIFGLTVCNAVLTFAVISWLTQPLLFVISAYRNTISRMEEAEADRNAVKEGYGEELIQTFKQVSSDELVDVNPPELVEFLEYDHPGMTTRIRQIHHAMQA